MRHIFILSPFMLFLLSQSPAYGFTTNCRIGGEGASVTVDQESMSSSKQETKPADTVKNLSTVSAKNANKSTVVVNTKSASKKIDIGKNDKTGITPGKLEFFSRNKKYDGELQKLNVAIPEGLDLKTITVYIGFMDALEGTADITLRDVPKEGAESASNSLRISQDGNKCEISITPAIEGSLAFDIVSQRDVLIKVGGIY